MCVCVCVWVCVGVCVYICVCVGVFSNGRDMTKCHGFCMTDDDENDDAKAITILRVFSETSRVENRLHRLERIDCFHKLQMSAQIMYKA